MFFLSLPVSVKPGDTIECQINGEPKQVTYRDAWTLVIGPDDARTVVDVWDDTTLRHFVCGDAEADGGTEGIVIIG